jgi:hypothetical protein
MLAMAVFDYAGAQEFGQADFASQDGVVRLMPWTAKECAAIACRAAPLSTLVQEVRKIERML